MLVGKNPGLTSAPIVYVVRLACYQRSKPQHMLDCTIESQGPSLRFFLAGALDREEGGEVGREVLNGCFEDFQPVHFRGGL